MPPRNFLTRLVLRRRTIRAPGDGGPLAPPRHGGARESPEDVTVPPQVGASVYLELYTQGSAVRLHSAAPPASLSLSHTPRRGLSSRRARAKATGCPRPFTLHCIPGTPPHSKIPSAGAFLLPRPNVPGKGRLSQIIQCAVQRRGSSAGATPARQLV